MVFVPVALNYDRVLEDTVLTAAALGTDRRFRARIGVITRWTLKQIWRRLIGRYKRFGMASVRYGQPISLQTFREHHQRDLTTDLARELMRRIAGAIPFVPLPAICRLVKENGEVPEAHLFRLLGGDLSEDTMRAVQDAVDQLVDRRILVRDQDVLRPSGQRSDLLAYYAASAAPGAPPPDAAIAKSISASAGS